jgi:6-phosphogluconolactonase/glucosamine-6-phosphate isomerase/deaminase
MSQANEIDLSKAIFVGLDEWVGISPQNTGSCWHSVNANLFEPLNINPQNIIFFDALLPDLQAECQRVDALVSQLGGFDLMLLGIGLNGHIAMNEPGTSWHLYSHVVALHEMTKTVGQKYFKDQTTLNQGITLGLRYVSEAKLAILMANGSHKTEVINNAINQPISEDFPATIFQTFANGLVMTSPQ